MNDDELSKLIKDEIEHIMAHEDDSEPETTRLGTRPNREAELLVHMGKAELAELTRRADEVDLPVSTYARQVLMATPSASGASLSDAKLEKTVEQAVERSVRKAIHEALRPEPDGN